MHISSSLAEGYIFRETLQKLKATALVGQIKKKIEHRVSPVLHNEKLRGGGWTRKGKKYLRCKVFACL